MPAITGISRMRDSTRSHRSGVPSSANSTHRDGHDLQQERRPAARMGRRILGHVRRIERIVVLPGVDRHVLGAVVGVDALHVGHQPDQGDVADQQRQPDDALGQIAPQRVARR